MASRSKVAVITGGASGIGLATSHRMLSAGWRVHSLDILPSPTEEVDSHIGDIGDPAWVEAVGVEIESPLDALVTAAGIWEADGDGPAERLALTSWDKTIRVNLTGTMLAVRYLQPRIVDGGSIVTISSIAGLVAMPHRDAYTASKGAVIALTRSWAIDYSRRGIRVNCVCPGVTDTPLVTERQSLLDEKQQMQLPQQRMATSAELAEVIGFLALPGSSYLSGAIVPVDGGTTALAAGLPFPRRIAEE